jgi:hypothetical protein
MLNSPDNKNLTKSTIYNAVVWGGLRCIAVKEWLARVDPPQDEAWFSTPFRYDAGVRRRRGLFLKKESNFDGHYTWNKI